MLKRILSFVLLFSMLFSLCACQFDWRGKMLIPTTYRPQTLFETYYQFYNGERKVRFTLGEDKPNLRGCIMNEPGVYSATLDIYIINESRYDVLIHGYLWVTNNLEKENTCQAIYYHRQKHVSNAGYEIHMDSMHNDYLSFEVLNDKALFATSIDTVVFVFFKYEDTEYVGGMKKQGDFIYWPLVDTLPESSTAP